MKSTDLMIGDWVLCDNTPYQIAEIGGMVCIDNENELFASLEDIQPIPLTTEILEKNGFETEDAKDGGFVLCDDFYDIFIYEWSDSIWVARYESTEMNIPFEQATMGYVHELQHFLRASGFEKEIEL